jgi:putative iron-dependent peroxidase
VSTPQPGIFALGTRSHYHLEFDLAPDVPTDRQLDSLAEAVSALREPAVTAGGSNLVVGFGPDLWRRLAPDDAPEALHPFTAIEGDGRRAPATQHDAWVWVHGTGPDVLLDNARAVTAALAPVLNLAAEQPCFVYHDSLDLTGFIDGTENPPVQEGPEVATVPPGEPSAGGAFVLTMQWVHDLAAFDALPVPEQQDVFGRTKPDSVELADKPPTAHISRVVIEEPGPDGEPAELEIFRRSAPWGTVTEHGLYFVAFSADPARFDRMLARMFGTSGDGLHDHLTDFSRPVSGSYYFAPSLESLAALGE